MPLTDLCASLMWSLTGALLGHAFVPVAERLSSVQGGKPAAQPPILQQPRVHGLAVRAAAEGRDASASALATAALFGLLAWRLGLSAELLAYSSLALFGVPLALIDLTELRLPTALILPLYPLTMGLLGLSAMIDGTYPDLLRAETGMIVLPATYLAVALLSRGGVGAGDIRLAGPIGLLLAWQNWTAVIAGTMLAFVYATHTRIVAGRKNRRTQVPFGPAMLGGMFTVVLIPWTS